MKEQILEINPKDFVEAFEFKDFNQKCIACGHKDTDGIEKPITSLNVKTKLCRKCFYTLVLES